MFTLVFIIGATLGAAWIYLMPEEKKALFTSYLQKYISAFAKGANPAKDSFKAGFMNQLKVNITFLLMGFFDMGILFAYSFLFIRGAALGFAGGCIVGLYSYKGFFYCACIFFADLIFITPSLLFACVCVRSFRSKIAASGAKAYQSFTAAYIVMLSFAFLINTLGTLVKSLCVPYILMHLNKGIL
jgi:hypothetical protein